MLQAIDEQGTVRQLGQHIVQCAVLEHFFSAFPLSNVAVHDDKPVHLAATALNWTGSGFKNAPITVLVAHAVFEPLTAATGPRLGRGLQHALAIRWMYLIDRRTSAELFFRITQDLEVRRTVVKPVART